MTSPARSSMDRSALCAGSGSGSSSSRRTNAGFKYPARLRIEPVDLPRERDRLPNVRNPADPRHGALDSQTESGMYEGAILAQVQVPAVPGGVEALCLDALEQPVVVILALRAPDDFAVALGRQTIVVEHRPRIGRVLLHVEGLDLLGVVADEDRL